MSKQKLFKLCLYVIILTGLAYALPVSAEPERLPKPQEMLRCGDDSLSRYEMWVKDLPCNPLSVLPEIPAPDAVPVREPAILQGGYPSAGDYTYVVYSRLVDNNWEIFGDTTPWDYDGLQYATRMTADSSSDLRPRLRPGSTQIVFASDRSGNYELYLMDWGGGNLQQLTWHEGYDSQAAWSPDGSRQAYVTELDGNLELAVMRADGSDWTRLTYDTVDDFNPAWSPDGTQLVWVKAYGDYHGVIHTMNADGSNDQIRTEPLFYAQHPYWSLEGITIAFDYDYNLNYWNDLVQMNVDGSNLSLLLGGYELYDYYAGPWTGVENNDLLYNEIDYFEYDDEIYISDMVIGSFNSSVGMGGRLQNSHYDMYPDAASIDISIPETHFLPLPEYSRAGNIDLTLTGYDPGPADIYAVWIEARLGVDGEWQNWGIVAFQPMMPLTYTVQAGETVYFRSSGWDMAEHREPYEEGDGDTHTTAYAWQLNGQVLDNRGIGIPNAYFYTEPAFEYNQEANLDGEFHIFAPATTIEVQVYGPGGYISPDSSVISSVVDVQIPWALRPYDDNLGNGTFESGLNGWFNSGDQAAFLDEEVSHTGQASASLGMTMLGTGAENVSDNTGQSAYVDAAVDEDGTLHAVWGDNTGDVKGSIIYSQKMITGTWSAPVLINPGHTKSSWQPHIAVGPDGTLHAVWIDSDYEGAIFYYSHRSADGTWSAADDISGSRYVWEPVETASPQVAVDSLNTVHVIWADQEGLQYINRPDGGVWSEPYQISGNYSPHKMVVDTSDSLHFVYSNELGIIYQTRSSTGDWSAAEVAVGEPIYNLDMDVDVQGAVHLVWRFMSGAMYSKRSAPGDWSSPLQLAKSGEDYELCITTDGGSVNFMGRGDFGVKYRKQFGDGTWSDLVWISRPELGMNMGISLVVQGDLASAFWSEVMSYEPYNTDIMSGEWSLAQDTHVALSSKVGVQDGMNRPTLSFHTYARQEGTGGSFSVQVNDTTIFSADELLPAWQHHWLDMTPWLGQLVTVTFSVDNDMSQGTLQVNLDDVSLGSWKTPVVMDVMPSRFEEWSSMVLTITGENFMETPTVRIGETEINDVIRVDEHTLQVQVPDGMASGIYSVWVINSMDWYGVWDRYLRVGEPQFIPCLVK